MKAKFSVNNEFRLKKDQTFPRVFPKRGHNKDGSVGELDQARRRAGALAKVSKIYETLVDRDQASYDVDFGDLKVHLLETELLELFDAA
jgi:hypothetical protein